MDQPPPDDAIAKLRAGFLDGLPKRRDAIAGLVNILIPGTGPEELQLLRNEVHKLVSISGIHGFAELSDSARQWERSLTARYMSGEAVQDTDIEDWHGHYINLNRTIDQLIARGA